MGIYPSALMGAMERYEHFLMNAAGLSVVTQVLPFEDDALLTAAQEYYSSPGFRARAQSAWICALNGPHWFNNVVTLPDVFRFAVDENFRQQQLQQQLSWGAA